MSKSIADEFKQFNLEMNDEQKRDTELAFFSGVLLGLRYGADGMDETLRRLEEVEDKLREFSVI